DRLVVRVEPGDVSLQPGERAPEDLALLGLVPVALADPGGLEQDRQLLGASPLGRQTVPAAQRRVYARADRVVRPGRPFRRSRPGDVGEPVAAGRGLTGGLPARRTHGQLRWHPVEAQM